LEDSLKSHKSSRAADVAVEIFNQAIFPDGMTEKTAWLGIYQTLLWLEEVPFKETKLLPHIIDSDKLRPAMGKAMGSVDLSGAWPVRALALAEYFSKKVGVSVSELPSKIGRLYEHPNWRGRQRQNPLGIGFAALVAHCLRLFVPNNWQFITEQPANKIFPDIKMTGRSKEPRIDIVGRHNGVLRVIISCKWSVRHDRLGDVSTECTVYKSEALRNRIRLSYFLVTNEYDPARLSKIIDDTCLDGTIHVHKPAVTEVCKLDGRLSRLLDLSDFFGLLLKLE
jgi:hypothetical protein